ncbi:hypothetical protein SLS62_001591 [Diatrype stigma]|uniref:D-xylose 1-dehydrogenase (NADP(+), D-xylono-1,5-lactone-forming) n=1 Tax=Diatrype stigma TaxID=117547 RepID=A0AAN9YWF5_9PEZI
MAGLFDMAKRNWQIRNPPGVVTKTAEPLRFGILGAADIAPNALISPAKTHPDVVVYAVAARDRGKAQSYAQKHGITEAKATYQDVLDDPMIDCVYIPLPNGLHFEWALRALQAGKHVLLEKPSVNNTEEAKMLFHHKLLSAPKAPVLLEAAHYLFHPAWTKFMTLITPSEVESAKAVIWVPMWQLSTDDIRYRYDLGGGALMDLGAYTASALVHIFGAVAEECEECVTEPGSFDARCDRLYRAKYIFPGGGRGEMEGDLSAPLDRLSPDIHVSHRSVSVSPDVAGVQIPEGHEMYRTRKVKFGTFVQPAYMHSITVDDSYELRLIGDTSGIVKSWTERQTIKAYTFRDTGAEQAGEPYWTTYRYMLEQFVDEVRGKTVKQWVTAEDSMNTARMLDMAYTRSGLGLRKTSEYRLKA